MVRVHRVAVLLAACAAAGCAPAGAPPATRAGAEPEYVLHTLPDWSPMGGIALGRHVFLQPSQQNPIGIGHELVHVRQQADGPVRFWATYVFSPHWRLRWEAEAYAVQARAGCPIQGDQGLAAYLSGPAYLWTASRADADRRIREFL
jgi:hypothetical protein